MKKIFFGLLLVPALFILSSTGVRAACVPIPASGLCESPNVYFCNYQSSTAATDCCTTANECNKCLPNSRICDSGGSKILKCDINGANYLLEKDCKSVSSTSKCFYTEGVPSCLTPAEGQCRAYTPGNASCVTDCIDCGKSQSECVQFCSGTTTPGQNISTNQQKRSEVTPVNIVDLNALIAGISFNSCLTEASGTITLGSIITCLLPYVYAFAGVGLLIFLMLAGFSYLTSAGDAKKAEAAKGKLTAAVIGFIIIIVAFWLTQIVNTVFKLGTGL